MLYDLRYSGEHIASFEISEKNQYVLCCDREHTILFLISLPRIVAIWGDFYPRLADSISWSVCLSVCMSVCLYVCLWTFFEKFQISLMALCDPSLTTYDPLRPYVGS